MQHNIIIISAMQHETTRHHPAITKQNIALAKRRTARDPHVEEDSNKNNKTSTAWAGSGTRHHHQRNIRYRRHRHHRPPCVPTSIWRRREESLCIRMLVRRSHREECIRFSQFAYTCSRHRHTISLEGPPHANHPTKHTQR